MSCTRTLLLFLGVVVGVKRHWVAAAKRLHCGARLWKSCCQWGPHFRNLKKEEGDEAATAAEEESCPSVSRTSRNSSTGAAAMMTQQRKAKPLYPHCLTVLCGFYLYAFVCLCSRVGAHSTLISLRSFAQAYVMAHAKRTRRPHSWRPCDDSVSMWNHQ